MAGLVTEVLPGGERAAAGERWRGLERALGHPGLACSWAWTETWLEHYSDVVDHRFVVARRGGDVRGIALLTRSIRRRYGPIPVRTLHVGTAGEPAGEGVYVEDNELLTHPDERAAFARSLVAEARRWGGWDELALDGFGLQSAEGLLAAGRFEVRRDPSPYLDLAALRARGVDVLDGLRSGPRGRVRRSLREYGGLTTEWADGVDRKLAIFDELVALHQSRWRAAGERGAFASPRVVAFHRALLERPPPGPATVLFRVAAGERTVACLYGLVDRGRFLFYQGGLTPADHPKLKPGLVAHVLCAQAALESGFDAYDFLAGEARYKRELADRERELVWATERTAWWLRAIVGVRSLRDR